MEDLTKLSVVTSAKGEVVEMVHTRFSNNTRNVYYHNWNEPEYIYTIIFVSITTIKQSSACPVSWGWETFTFVMIF